jgi:GxxExxY protein
MIAFGARGTMNQRMTQQRLVEGALTGSVIGAFYEVYNTLGFGFLEKVYIRALAYELMERGHRITRESSVAVYYKGMVIARQRLDLIVDDKLVVETKSSYELHPAARRQLYNYLRGTKLDLGLLLHFGPKPVFHRVYTTWERRASVADTPDAGACINGGSTDDADITDDADCSRRD